MNTEISAIEAKIGAEIARWNMLPRGCRVVVGLSGGADSVALTHYLAAHAEEYGVSLTAAHVNHGLRGEEAARDEQFAVDFCRKYGIDFQVLHADVRTEAKSRSLGLEECGRNVRYSFFRRLCGENGRIATAHTLSDSAETMLMNLARGTGTKGMSGIPPVRGNVVRPLLGITRAEVESYCSAYGLSFVTDSSNLSEEFTRNRLRLQAVPVFREINPEFEAAAARAAEIFREDEAYFETLAGEALAAAALPSGGYRTETLRQLPRPVLLRAIPLLLERVVSARQSCANLLAVERLICSGGGAVTASGAIRCSVSRGVLFVSEEESHAPVPEDWSVPLTPSGKAILPDGRVFLLRRVTPQEAKNGGKFNNLVFNNFLNYDTIIETGCFLRNRRAGDAYRPAGRGVTKSVRKLFSEAGLSLPERGRRAILESGGKILWVEGFGVSEEAPKPGRPEEICEIIIKER